VDHAAERGLRARGRHVAQAFFGDVSMMWMEILIGFFIAAMLMTLVPPEGWRFLFLSDAPVPLRLVENAFVGVIIAAISCVCSVGNLPLAAGLWSGGISFGGVISFIYADLVIIPLLLIYRKYYGMKAAAYIAAILAASMVLAGIVVDLIFSALGLVPQGERPASPMQMDTFQWNYTTWLDFVALVVVAVMGYFYFGKSPTEHQEHDELIPGHHGAH
jgi:uncharacterized membrane protein YraQ (UPF0718 family)